MVVCAPVFMREHAGFSSEKFGAFGEVGVGLYPIVLGVTFKLK